jgi:hypothetical protein
VPLSAAVWCVPVVWPPFLPCQVSLTRFLCLLISLVLSFCPVLLQTSSWGTSVANVQGDQKVSVHLMITVQKTRQNILNSFNHLPW